MFKRFWSKWWGKLIVAFLILGVIVPILLVVSYMQFWDSAWPSNNDPKTPPEVQKSVSRAQDCKIRNQLQIDLRNGDGYLNYWENQVGDYKGDRKSLDFYQDVYNEIETYNNAISTLIKGANKMTNSDVKQDTLWLANALIQHITVLTNTFGFDKNGKLIPQDYTSDPDEIRFQDRADENFNLASDAWHSVCK